MNFIDRLAAIGIVAVIRGADAADAVAMSEALLRGGIRGIELTFSTPDNITALLRVKALAPADAIVGVGTVRESAQVEKSVAAGADFIVSPHFEPEVAVAALEGKVPFLPGCMTPTEIVQAWQSGATAIKIFPANVLGPDFIKSLRGPLPDIPLMPTGGVSVNNLETWFASGAIAVGMGGNLAKGSPESIEEEARRATAELKRIRGSQN
jgi:2-dehydro-3-deoxyphosphogluconate aldolase/(4S)-4-hydroxy-2-oxoglutarate aldolase